MDDRDRLDDDVDEVCYIYSKQPKGTFRFDVRCGIPPGLDDKATVHALRELYDSCVLEGLDEGMDYRWSGMDKISFRDEENAVLFLLSVDANIKKM